MPLPGDLAQTVHAYALDDFDEVMTWLHETHALGGGHRRDRRAHQDRPGAGRRSRCCWSPALALVADAAEADRALAPFRTSPALDRALLVVDAVPTTLDEQRAAPARWTTPRATAGRSTTPG